jgi:hypothetical protein
MCHLWGWKSRIFVRIGVVLAEQERDKARSAPKPSHSLSMMAQPNFAGYARVYQRTLRVLYELSELLVQWAWFVGRGMEVFSHCIRLEPGGPLNPHDAKRDALNKELLHLSARLVLAFELPTQELVAALVINFADPFRAKPMFQGGGYEKTGIPFWGFPV